MLSQIVGDVIPGIDPSILTLDFKSRLGRKSVNHEVVVAMWTILVTRCVNTHHGRYALGGLHYLSSKSSTSFLKHFLHFLQANVLGEYSISHYSSRQL